MPTWAGRLDEIVGELTSLPCPEIDSAQLAEKLGVKRRRAQVILEPLLTKRTVGASVLVPKDAVVVRLRQMVAGEGAKAEQERRARLHALLESARAEARQPRVLVEAPVAIMQQELENLPPGVSLAPWPHRPRRLPHRRGSAAEDFGFDHGYGQ